MEQYDTIDIEENAGRDLLRDQSIVINEVGYVLWT